MWDWIIRTIRQINEWIRNIFRRPGQPAPPLRDLQVSLDPGSGPTGTQTRVTVRGLRPGETVTITVGVGSTVATANSQGVASTSETITDLSGDVTVTATAGSGADTQTDTATFTVTN